VGLSIEYSGGQTPLDAEELDDLLIPTILTRADLDEFEQLNIESAVQWTMSRSFSIDEVLSVEGIRELHARMFGQVWRWAGEFRRTNKNLGVDKFEIGIELRKLLDDTRFWIEHGTYVQDEIAVRFKHRLVFIHCFPNGNGRHARLMSDILIEKVFGRPLFTWGRASLIPAGEARSAYLAALRAADDGHVLPLIAFARS
jgi:Fic-DOC domain mobile mystery protein B